MTPEGLWDAFATFVVCIWHLTIYVVHCQLRLVLYEVWESILESWNI